MKASLTVGQIQALLAVSREALEVAPHVAPPSLQTAVEKLEKALRWRQAHVWMRNNPPACECGAARVAEDFVAQQCTSCGQEIEHGRLRIAG